MSGIGLTFQQDKLLAFLKKRATESNVSPSFDEMADHLGLGSKSGVHRLITGLEERGHIRRQPHRARAIEIVDIENGDPIEHFRSRLLATLSTKPDDALVSIRQVRNWLRKAA